MYVAYNCNGRIKNEGFTGSQTHYKSSNILETAQHGELGILLQHTTIRKWCVAYQIVLFQVTLSDFQVQGHLSILSFFKYDFSYSCVALANISSHLKHLASLPSAIAEPFIWGKGTV